MKILVTGGAGFIGSALIRFLINNTTAHVMNVDKLTYAGDLSALTSIVNNHRYHFKQVDICSFSAMQSVIAAFQPDAIMHLAAESHVDRSINSAEVFMHTNIMGTYTLLETTLAYWQSLPTSKKNLFRFHHISTDEVYGDLGDADELFTETTAYAPSSPYSASKACSDHLVRAWGRTHGLPVVITNCSNNYGPYQYPEKLIPTIIYNALAAKPLPVYGNGKQIRDWLHVDDHVRALYLVLTQGKISETYNIGGHEQKQNLEVIYQVCSALEMVVPARKIGISRYSDLITFVQDRPGHDQHYAIDATKIKQALNWSPQETFESGIRKTVSWYVHNRIAVQHVQLNKAMF